MEKDELPHPTLFRRAFLLACFTVGYNMLEGIVSIIAGRVADSSALVGFGLDSFVESLSGGIIIWRFRQRRQDYKEEERIERKATKLVGWLFFIFAGYVLYDSAKSLAAQEIPAANLFGITIAIASLIVMPCLFYLKQKTGKTLRSTSLIADSKQTLACVGMSFALLLGIGLNRLFGFWRADPIVGLLICGYLVLEGFKTLKEARPCTC